MKTKIRLLRKEQSDQGRHCLPISSIFWTFYFTIKPHCPNFRIAITIFSGSKFFVDVYSYHVHPPTISSTLTFASSIISRHRLRPSSFSRVLYALFTAEKISKVILLTSIFQMTDRYKDCDYINVYGHLN